MNLPAFRSRNLGWRIFPWYSSVCGAYVIFCYLLYFYSHLLDPATNYQSRPPPDLLYIQQVPPSPEQDFRHHWYRQREPRVNWKLIIRPCLDNMAWGRVKPGWDKSQRTNASTSSILYQDIRPAREFSRVFIQSRTKDGQNKTIGGDSWRVYLRGPSSIAATVFDHNNGTYEALFLVMEPGTYELKIILDFSLCDGFRDPPLDWFIKGDGQGKNQKEGTLGYLDDFLLETMDRQLSINVTKPRMTTPIENILSQSSNDIACDFLMDGFGRWINDRIWLPYLNESSNARVEPGRHVASGELMVYGDSMAMRFGKSLAPNKKLCGQLYKSCSFAYNWIYSITNGKVINDDFDFDEDRVIRPIKEKLENPAMNNNSSAFVFNMGLHFVMSINFTTFQHLTDKVIGLFLEKQGIGRNSSEAKYRARIIWKTTTAVTKENAAARNLTAWRFLMNQRIILFNSYATWAMCKAGIPVLDVHPVSDSFAPGAGDVVHYSDFVFSNAEKTLEIFKIDELNGK